MFRFKITTDKEQLSQCSESNGACCTPKPKGKSNCPVCGKEAKAVLKKTLEALLTPQEKTKHSELEVFYYCKTPSCKVVYFKENQIIEQDGVRVTVGLKEWADPATCCYCFGWTKEKIKEQLEATGKTDAIEDIKAKMKDPGCSCETLNPSGGCCLGDTGKVIKEIKASLRIV
jgi:hypothetical protein